LRAGPRLATDRLHFEHERAQSFRGAVHCRRESCRTGADDNQIEATVRYPSDREPEVVGQSTCSRTAQHLARDDDHGYVACGDLELSQEALDVALGVQIQPLVWDSIADQEFANPVRVW